MSSLDKKPTLKAVNAHKKQLTWGDVPAIYHLVSSSLSELDGILSHGFDSAFKQVLDRNNWNLSLLQGYKDNQGSIQVKTKPQIILRHEFNDMGYELHCYPTINGEKVLTRLVNDKQCPFQHWAPEHMRMLFRINSLVAFSIFTFQSGDEADLALIKYAYFRVNELINILSESFDILAVEDYNIAEFYQEIDRRNGNVLSNDESPNTTAN